jgi:hypothetical protein
MQLIPSSLEIGDLSLHGRNREWGYIPARPDEPPTQPATFPKRACQYDDDCRDALGLCQFSKVEFTWILKHRLNPLVGGIDNA